MKLCEKHNVNIYPVDSEHSAIYQCLVGEKHETIEKYENSQHAKNAKSCFHFGLGLREVDLPPLGSM